MNVISLDLLNLPGIRTTKATETDTQFRVEAETIKPAFPDCCGLFRDVVKDGVRKKRRIINDTQHGGKPTVIEMKVQRGKCRHCGKRGMDEILPGIRPGRHMTERLFRFIAQQGLIQTNSAVGRFVHVSEGTARDVIHEFIDGKITDLNRQTPRVLGVDEKKIVRHYRAVLGNLEERTILDMLPDRDTTLENHLDRLPEKGKVEVFVSDMYAPYARMCRKYLPGVLHVTDHFHVVRRGNLAVDKIRAAIAAGLDGRERIALRNAKKLYGMRSKKLDGPAAEKVQRWNSMHPALGEAYWAKERYYEMYEVCHTPAEAEIYYKNWMRTLPEKIRPTFETHCTIQPFWRNAVFAFFDEPYTTGYVEAVNRTIDDLNRAGRGYSFEIMRGKLMLAPKLQSVTFRDRNPGAFTRGGDTTPLFTFNWGVDVAKLRSSVNAVMTLLTKIDGGWQERVTRDLTTILEDRPEWL